MSRPRPGRRRLLRGAVAVAVLLATGAVLRWGGLEVADNLAGVLSLLIVIGTLLWPVRPEPGAVTRTFLADPGPVLDALADHNLTQVWDQEWRRRRLHDPGPLPVCWTNDDTLADHWENIRDTDGPAEPLPLDGCWHDLADTFERVPSRRLVAVGEGGCGKTVLCLHLARRLHAVRPPGGPVPVILALSGWNPLALGLDEWVAERLPIDVSPGLAEDAGDGRSIAEAIVEDGHVVLILDGLDELPGAVRERAVARINHARRNPLFLTCRRAEFAAATVRNRVRAAAVVEVRRLPAADVASWLDRTASPSADGTTKWTAALADSPVVQAALTSPLFATLARSVYSTTDADPVELGAAGDGEPAGVEQVLLDRLVPTSYGAAWDVNPSRWPPDVAERYLVALARGLAASDVDRLEWWRLDRTLSPRWVRLAKAAAVGLVVAAGAVVLRWISPVGPDLLAAATLTAFSMVAVLVVEPGGRDRLPAAQRLSWPHGGAAALDMIGRAALRGFVFGGAAGAVVGILLVALAPADGTNATVYAVAMVGGALAFGVIVLGLAVAVVVPLALLDAVSRPLPIEHIPDPESVLRVDRRWSLVRAAAFGAVVGATLISALSAVVGAVMLLVAWYANTTPPDTAWSGMGPPDLGSATTVGLIAALVFLLTSTAWGRFAFARAYLAARGRVPWRLMAFLADARDRGVLRQVGAAYAFRHERLQSRLMDRVDVEAGTAEELLTGRSPPVT